MPDSFSFSFSFSVGSGVGVGVGVGIGIGIGVGIGGRGGEEGGGDDLPACTVSDAPGSCRPRRLEVEARVQEREERTPDDNEQPERP